MIIKSANFIVSNTHVDKCPEEKYPEYAFIGRSNVGKSTLINMLVDNKSLAKISSKPGKTQLINHFLINESWYLVDLPGYGYAKLSKEKRKSFEAMINNYFLNRKNLMNVFVLIDSRIPIQNSDLSFMQNLGMKNIPFSIVFTKTDKLTNPKRDSNIATYKKEILKYWEEFPPYFVSSSITKKGRLEILNYIEESNKMFTV